MKCPFCAESIMDDAILCRFCGAARQGRAWNPPPQPGRIHDVVRLPAAPSDSAAQAGTPRPAAGDVQPGRGGRGTIRLTGVLFVLSAVYELATVTSRVPLAGEMRSGAWAVTFHLLFVAAFAATGAGLLAGKPWGFWTTMGATAFYTLERGVFLLDGSAREAYLQAFLGDLPAYRDIIDPGLVRTMLVLEVALFVACWWGFALYVYMWRAYFGLGARNGPQGPVHRHGDTTETVNGSAGGAA